MFLLCSKGLAFRLIGDPFLHLLNHIYIDSTYSCTVDVFPTVNKPSHGLGFTSTLWMNALPLW
jgi:hypothetical protein